MTAEEYWTKISDEDRAELGEMGRAIGGDRDVSFNPLAGVDYTVTDPSIVDPDFPPEHFMTHFISQGSVVHAAMWIAGGREPKGCVIISPQAFGGDRLESLIIPLLSSGISVMTFHPRGMWDGEHHYSLISSLDDMHAAVDFVRSAEDAGKRTFQNKAYRIDPERIAVLGLSGGGGSVSFSACAEIQSVKAAIAIAPANHEQYRNISASDLPMEHLEIVKTETAGRVDSASRVLSMSEAEIDRLSIPHNATRLARKKLLLIGATNDLSTPLASCHRPIAQALVEAGASHFTEVILDTDHLFLTKRIALARIVISWLRSEAGF